LTDIILLDQETTNQIAAGEVIERPSSVVKELVENSIDALASKIEIEITGGGLKSIRVADNGAGMSRENAFLSLRRHATSKIKGPEDLYNISTLGFRGEALPSIASVSRLTLRTRPKDNLEGTEIIVKGGEVLKDARKGCPAGTDILVEDLFFNTPARRKFLKSEGIEVGKISDIINRLALSYPNISFSLKREGRQLLNTWGRGDMLEVISLVYGRNKARFFIPVKEEKEDCVIKGFIGSPSIYRSGRKHQTFFVNGRYVTSSLLTRALEDAFSTLLSRNCYPVAVLQLQVNPHLLDVNVHPTKIEVKFSQEDYIYQKVYEGVREALRKENLIPEVSFRNKEEEKSQVFEQKSFYHKGTSTTGDTGEDSREYVKEEVVSALKGMAKEDFGEDEIEPLEAPEDRDQESFKKEVNVHILGNFLGTYILAQRDRELLIIDQHAAHERIIYEELKEQVISGLQHQEIIPMFLEVPSGSGIIIEENLSFWGKMGFVIEKFGTNSYVLRSVPLFLKNFYSQSLIEDIIDSFPQRGDLEKAREEVLKTMACKASYKANYRISREEAEALVEKLFESKIPFTCPHGRPTMISLEESQLEKNFKRGVS